MVRYWDAGRIAEIAQAEEGRLGSLSPLTDEDIEEIATAFAARLPDGMPPDPRSGWVDLTGTHFAKPLWLSGFVFPDPMDLSRARFDGDVMAEGALFWRGVTFAGSVFAGDTLLVAANVGAGLSFEGAQVGGHLSLSKLRGAGLSLEQARIINGLELEDAMINGPVSARGVQIGGTVSAAGFAVPRQIDTVDFTEARCGGFTDFNKANFGGQALFGSARFAGLASFRSCQFGDAAQFAAADFQQDADFSGSRFAEGADFTGATFLGLPEFSDGAFHGPTRFQDARFLTQPPRFFGSRLHADLGFSLRQGNWPRLTSASAATAKPAFTRLRHAVQDLQMADEEHFFFRQEMRCKGMLDGWPDRWLIRAYGVFSDYGNSVTRPMAALAGLVGLGMVAVMLGLGLSAPEALGISILSALPFLGLLPVVHPGFHAAAPPWLDALSVAQGVAGFALLFFLGLGLRNRFRLK